MQVVFLGMLDMVNAISIDSMIAVLFTFPLMTATRKSRQTEYDKQQALAGEKPFFFAILWASVHWLGNNLNNSFGRHFKNYQGKPLRTELRLIQDLYKPQVRR